MFISWDYKVAMPESSRLWANTYPSALWSTGQNLAMKNPSQSRASGFLQWYLLSVSCTNSFVAKKTHCQCMQSGAFWREKLSLPWNSPSLDQLHNWRENLRIPECPRNRRNKYVHIINNTMLLPQNTALSLARFLARNWSRTRKAQSLAVRSGGCCKNRCV